MTGDQAHEALLLESYRAALASKHHYDVLSWTVGGGTLVFAAAAMAYIPGIRGTGYWPTVFARLPAALFAVVLLIGWHRVYERNRLWGEVANEFMRHVERMQRMEGIALAFMKAHLDRGVVLANTDEAGSKYRGSEPRVEQATARSMHMTIRGMVWVLSLLLIGACLLPGQPTG